MAPHDKQSAPPAEGIGAERLGEYFLTRPLTRPGGPRVVGPGRLERRYRERVSDLEQDLEQEAGRARALARELETSQLVERGSQRLLDRLEGLARDERAAREALEQREKRLILCLGGLQRENELLRERLALAGDGAPRAIAAGAGAAGAERGAARGRRAGATRSTGPVTAGGWLARLFRR
jgi:hypothetical protein